MKTNTMEKTNLLNGSDNKIDKLQDLCNQFNQILEVVEANYEDESFSIRDIERLFFNAYTKDAYFEILCSFSETITSDELSVLCFNRVEKLSDEMYEIEKRRDENSNEILINRKLDLEDEINLISTEINNRKIFIDSDNKFSDISSKELKKMVSKLNQDIQKISKEIKAL